MGVRGSDLSPLRGKARKGRHRRAQALVEFALIALVLYLLLAATIEFGRAIFAAQVLQSAADLMARELSHTRLPVGATFAQALNDPGVKAKVYSKYALIYPLPDGGGLEAFLKDPNVPAVNKQLGVLMIPDTIDDQNVLRYPGTVAQDANGRYVTIPLVNENETITTVDVVEEVGATGQDSPFSFTSPQRGLIAVRINYPFQAATMSAYQKKTSDTDPLVPIEADPGDAGPPFGTYAGSDGLGRQAAWGKTVRPYRRILSLQALGRRELAY